MPAAIAVPLIIGAASTGAQLYGAKKGADAAKSAAKQQQDSVGKAQDFTERAWQQQQEALNPYRQAGQYSLAALMARQYGGNAQQYLPPQGYGQPQAPQPQMQGAPQFGSASAMPNPMSLAAMQNRGTQHMNAGQVGMMNIPPAIRRQQGF